MGVGRGGAADDLHARWWLGIVGGAAEERRRGVQNSRHAPLLERSQYRICVRR